MDNQSQIPDHGRPGNWDPTIDTILKSNAALGPSRLDKSVRQIRKQNPSLSLNRILKRTAELKLTSWKTPWTDEEKTFVLEHAREFSVADIARRLGRTSRAVYLLLARSGESARFQDGYTQSQLAEALRVSRRKVRQWVRLGWLLLYQGRIKDRSLKRFLEGHSEEIDAKRLESDVKLWLEDLGFREDAVHPVQWFYQRKQSLRVHICNRCGRKIHGNAFHRHLKVCAKKAPAAIDETDNQRTY